VEYGLIGTLDNPKIYWLVIPVIWRMKYKKTYSIDAAHANFDITNRNLNFTLHLILLI
jgi:hypothetical protein